MKNQELLECIIPYSPYGLKARYKNEMEIETVIAINTKKFECQTDKRGGLISNFKYYLHSLIDIGNPCLEGGKVPIMELLKIKKLDIFDNRPPSEEDDFPNYKHIGKAKYWFFEVITTPNGIDNLPSWMVTQLIKWNFDIFDLIEKGYAEEIKTLELSKKNEK
ncbi:hypothetical protein [Alistipes sp. ZOR0009]|uniref:hypothetical protein n=1 Tax=Alistipes sp. ZOR0009 TaxID=1339253 RepID=UPI000645AA5B|nr:hypothetical protein [Alistipes sp. ZOR0009]